MLKANDQYKYTAWCIYIYYDAWSPDHMLTSPYSKKLYISGFKQYLKVKYGNNHNIKEV